MPVSISKIKKVEKNTRMLIIIDFILIDEMPANSSDVRAKDTKENKLKKSIYR
jgi:hypothetical protein